MANGGWDPAAPGAELERLARRYWDAWQSALQRTMPGAPTSGFAAGMPGFAPDAAPWSAAPWRAVFDAWTQAQAPGPSSPDDLLQRFNRQAGDWWARMQAVAERFVGQSPSPDAVVRAWREALGGEGANPFAQMLGGLGGAGTEGWDGWLRALQPMLDALRGDGRDPWTWPTFGPAREHQARWQALARAFAEYPQSQQAYQALLLQASQAAFSVFEHRLSGLDAPGTRIESPRALFDLWIEAAEEAYAEVALSPAFRTAYAEMVAGQMRLRQALQREIEHACRLLDLPTRSELDGAHRKIVDLERALRGLRDRVDGLEGATRDDRDDAPSAAATEPPRRPAGPTRVVDAGASASVPTAPARRTAATTVQKATTRKTASKRTVSKQAVQKAAQKRAAQKKAGTRASATKKAASKRPAAKTAAATRPARTPVAKRATTAAPATRTTDRRAATKRAAPAPASTKRSASKRAPKKRAGAATEGVRARVPRGLATAAATSRRDDRAGTLKRTVASPAARKRAAAPARTARLPNLGFVSPIPQAPEPLTSARSRTRKR